MKPYCGWRRAIRNDGIRWDKLGSSSHWHRPEGIVRIEYEATMRALKRSERQRARREVVQEFIHYWEMSNELVSYDKYYSRTY